MNILLTGATGFLGSHLLKGILQDGHTVYVIKRVTSDISRIREEIKQCRVYNSDEADIDQIFRENQIDCIIHCATHYGRDDSECMQNVETNLLFPLKLMRNGCNHGLKYFINTDSFFTKQFKDGDKRADNFYMYGYTLSKVQFRQWGKMFAKKYGIEFINMQLEHVYGDNDTPGKFIPYVASCMTDHVPILQLSPGSQKRDFIHVSDVVEAYRCVICHLPYGRGYCTFEVGTGKMYSLRDFVEIMKAALESDTKLQWGAVPMKEGEIMESRADNIQLREIGWKPHIVEKEEIERMFAGGQ